MTVIIIDHDISARMQKKAKPTMCCGIAVLEGALRSPQCERNVCGLIEELT